MSSSVLCAKCTGLLLSDDPSHLTRAPSTPEQSSNMYHCHPAVLTSTSSDGARAVLLQGVGERRKLLVGVRHHGLACRPRGFLHGSGDSVLDRDPEVSVDLFLELHALEMRVVVEGLVGDALERSRPPRGFTPRAVGVRSVDCVYTPRVST